MTSVNLFRILLLLFAVSEYKMCLCGEILTPRQYTALSGDLRVDVLGVSSPGCVQLLERLRDDQYSVLGTVAIMGTTVQEPGVPLHQVVFPCGVICHGGQFGLRLASGLECTSNSSTYSSTTTSVDDNETTETDVTTTSWHSTEDDIVPLDVRWPGVTLEAEPKSVQTYPEQPVVARVMFHNTYCQPSIGSLVPETWLNLVYCGHSPLGCVNSTHKQVLYSEQILGYPSLRETTLACNLFGLAGHYALALRTTINTSSHLISYTPQDHTVKVEWSDKFVFNVHARSIFPCDGHGGIPVLFQYPSCILETGDRVRVFGRLRADVTAGAPPSTLHYIAEHRVTRGQHALNFDCELFTERYVEYCFVYVSQAISGAVSDVRMDCVPTLPVHEAESGGWGSWTSWTQCTTTCSGGTRNRYRLCDSPPPRYGARFCEGHALETERCGTALAWDCPFYQEGADVPAERPEVKAEVGPGCRCGCVVHLGVAKPRRLVASSSQSCPGRTFWLIQADRNQLIRLSLEQFRLPCSAQWLKVRDGDSLSSTLLAHLTGVLGSHSIINSSANFLLLEFFSDELAAIGEECWGGFLAHVQQIERTGNVTSGSEVSMSPTISPLERLALVHIAVILLLVVVLLTSTCLGAQYMHRYRKYQLAAHDDLESLAVSLGESMGSLVPARSRATSSTTLLSEVISLRRFRPHRHTRLPDHDDVEEDEEQELESSVESHREDEQKEEQEARVSVADSTADVEMRPTSLDVKQHRTPRHNQETVRIHKSYKKYKSPVSPVVEKPESPEDQDSSQQTLSPPPPGRRSSNGLSRPSVSSSVSSSLTNALSSPASSLRSNPKETKEKRNRERLLAGSEFSLAGEMEMDYYDYNVSNASTVPGSFLGMDPAFCLWIPPFAPGQWDDEEDDELIGKSDSEDTEMKDLGGLKDRTPGEDLVKETTDFSEGKEDSGSATPVNIEDTKSEKSFHDCYSLRETSDLEEVRIKLVEKLVPVSPAKVHRAYRVKEKETGVEKSPSDSGEYYDLLNNDDADDIKFADDDDETEDDYVERKQTDIVIPKVRSNRSSYYDA
ncbi:uncharacterized protein LOC128992100 [Macrosteles quadrilineatus]|uniref:uncharacterized protein LOC128992100 n=1 Tax=Macrosteles quadrilineatus TaxID=74068 RepID=UPI0023E0E804|nr:uncharacterized protein LOC128992100 [Macrosteles quadrilineatus]